MAGTNATPKRRRADGPVKLDRLARECLGPVVNRYGFGSAEMVAAWPDIVGDDLGARTRPERIRWPRRRDGDGDAATLVVRAEGGDAMELQHMSERVVERINAFFGWRAVGRLSIRQGPVARAAPDSDARASPAPPAPATRARLTRIEDPQLRESLAELAGLVRAKPDKSP